MDYSTERKRFWRKVIKHRIVEAFGEECHCCHQHFEDCCYDLHHIDPNQKDITISSIGFNGAKSWLKIRDELKKCILVCSNCHRLIHNNYIENNFESDFNEDYYDWDLIDFKQINSELEPIDADYVCPVCGGVKSSKAKKCAECAKKEQTRFEVSREELKELIRNNSFAELGRRFNVSDNAIRKRCIKYGLPSKASDIKKMSDEEWKNI